MASLRPLIETLASVEPSDSPVVSLYLNLEPDQRGRDNYETFIRKEFRERLKSYDARSAERAALERDFERIRNYLALQVDPAAHGLAVFACGDRDLFETVQLDAPVAQHRLYIDREPHLYPLARLDDQYPRYAALLLNTNSARLFVFSGGGVERTESLQNVKTRRTSQGGWSQNRYQRHTANFHLLHVKEAIDMLDRVVREEGVPKIILSGDEVVLPIVREQLSKELADKVIDFNNLDTASAETDVLRATLERLRDHDAHDDRERVARLLDEYRAGGLAVVGADATRAALEMGQVDELLVSAVMDRAGVPGSGAPDTLQPTSAAGTPAAEPLPSNVVRAVAETAGANQGGVTAVVSAAAAAEPIPDVERAAEEFVTKAAQTGAKVTFIEDPALLADVGGVGALLRFRI